MLRSSNKLGIWGFTWGARWMGNPVAGPNMCLMTSSFLLLSDMSFRKCVIDEIYDS